MMPQRTMSIGDWAMLGLCALFWGSAYTFNKVTIAEIPVFTVTGVRLVIAAAFLYVLARCACRPRGRTAIFGSALASYTYFQVFRRAGAVNTMLVTMLVPVTPIIIGAIVFGERLLLREIIGALIIAGALIIIDGRLPRYVVARVSGRSDA